MAPEHREAAEYAAAAPELEREATGFTRWAIEQPTKEGPYLWRMPSTGVPGLTVEFVAWMRERGAGYKLVISPAFDYWDGYSVHVPANVSWAPTSIACKSHEYVAISAGIDPIVCPYCDCKPTLRGALNLNFGGGTHYGAKPYEWNTWWFECCGWMKGLTGPHRSDPRELNSVRNEKLRSFARAHA